VRDARGCPLPRWDEDAPKRPQTEDDCAVLGVPQWFMSLRLRLQRRDAGHIQSEPTAQEMILLEAMSGAMARGERLEQERRKRREEIRRATQDAAKIGARPHFPR